jgi:hypothetical protein
VFTGNGGLKSGDAGGCDVVGLVVAVQADERMHEAEVAGDDVQRALGEFRRGDGPVSGYPRGVSLVLAGEGSGGGLVGPSTEAVQALHLCASLASSTDLKHRQEAQQASLNSARRDSWVSVHASSTSWVSASRSAGTPAGVSVPKTVARAGWPESAKPRPSRSLPARSHRAVRAMRPAVDRRRWG